MNFEWITDPRFVGFFIDGFINTLILIFVSGTLGFLLAILVALAQVSGPKPVRWTALSFTTVIRGTPLLVQLFLFYDAVGGALLSIQGIRETIFFDVLRDAFFYAIVAFTISVAAYTGEVLRGAMLSVPRGELEAARAFGLSRTQVLLRIWIPRAVQICLPTLTGEAILLLKSVPLVSTIAVVDLLKAANLVRDRTFLVYEPLLLVAGIYVAMSLVLTLAMRQVERTFPGVRPAGAGGSWLRPGRL